MHRILSKSKTFYRYLLSYALVLLIPLVVMLVLIQTVILPEMKSDIVRVNLENLKKASEQIENKYSVLEKIAFGISSNQKLTPYMMKENSLEGLQQLFSYKQSNDFFYDILYVVKGNDLIYGAYNQASGDMLTKILYPFKEWQNGGFENEIKRAELPFSISLKLENGDDFVAYYYPLQLNQPYAVVIFLIKASAFRNIIQGLYTDYNENVIILDRNNQLIAALNSNTDIIAHQMQLINNYMRSKTVKTQSALKENSLITIYKSSKNDWKYVSIADNRKLMEKIHRINVVIILVVFSVFVFGAILIFWLSRKNYSPIDTLLRKISEKLGMQSKGDREFEFIGGAFDEIISINEYLEKSIDAHRPILREYVLKELLKGNGISELITEDTKNVLLMQDGCYYQCLVFKEHKTKQDNDLQINTESLICSFKEKWGENIKICYVDTIEKNKNIYILSMIRDELENTEKTIQEIYCYLSHEIKTKITIGVGNIYSDIISIGQSYLEASQAIDSYQSNFNRSDCILYYEKIMQNEKSEKEENVYPYEELNQLIAFIKQGEDEHIRSMLHRIFSDIAKRNLPKFLLRCITLDIFNVIVNIMMENELNYKEFKEKYLDSFSNKKYVDAHELNQDLVILIIEMCENICSQIKKKNDTFNGIISYIHNHCFEYNFTSEELANHVGMSSAYLSRYFKEKTGGTLSNYLWNLRLEKAKHLLIESNNTVNDIVTSVGFIDVPTFTRRFKNSEGISPGEYRKSKKQI